MPSLFCGIDHLTVHYSFLILQLKLSVITVCVCVLQKPQGVLCIIDEESQSLRPCEVNLYKRLQIQLDSSGLDAVSLTTKDGNGNPPPKDQGPSFTVTHYAGKVGYGKLQVHTCTC